MPKATPQQLDERRLKRAYKQYQDARAKLNAHVEEHEDVFEEAYELSDTVNTKRKALEKVVREVKMGVGPITVTISRQPVYDVDYVESIAKGDEFADLIRVKKTVQRKVFEALVSQGVLNQTQVKKAILEIKESPRVSGMPDEIVLP